MWGLCVLLAVPTLVLIVVGPGRALPADIFSGAGGVAFLFLALSFASVGLVVAVRVPGNRIGWVFCLTGFLSCLQLFTWNFADVGLHAHALPGSGVATVFNSVISEATAGLLALSLLLFPDGRLPSRSWRPALGAVVGGVLLLVVAGTLYPGHYAQPFAQQANPLTLSGVGRSAINTVDLGGWLLVLVGLVSGAVGLVVRLRGSHGVERQQLKLVLAVGTLAGLAAAILMTGWLTAPAGGIAPHNPGRAGMAALGLVLTTFPLAAGVAILRYRLYDIDLVIRRTISYLILTGLLVAVFLGIVLVTTRVLPFSSPVAVAASTLAATALFNPLRLRVQRLVDQRFNRARYDAEETVTAFRMRLREAVDLDTVQRELLRTVNRAVEPAHTTLSIRPSEPGRHQ
jgi:hypothetical protein